RAAQGALGTAVGVREVPDRGEHTGRSQLDAGADKEAWRSARVARARGIRFGKMNADAAVVDDDSAVAAIGLHATQTRPRTDAAARVAAATARSASDGPALFATATCPCRATARARAATRAACRGAT